MGLDYKDSLSAVLANNRSEHIGMDVWDDFVIPYFYPKIDFASSFPLRLEGGRGSGKTMLLRYLSYHSRFSEKRKCVEKQELAAVGLYMRADTQFLRQLQKRGVEDEKWQSVFSHYVNVYLLVELANAFVKISNVEYSDGSRVCFDREEFTSLADYDASLKGDLGSLNESFRRLRKRCELAVANPKLIDDILILPDSVLSDFINEAKEKTGVRDLKFKVYVDEYENLLRYQQYVINTRIKHSEPPLIFNIAVKLNGAPYSETVGSESISYKHDYTIENLDARLVGDSFECFAAEILFLRLSKTDGSFKKIFDGVKLNSVEDIGLRAEKTYKDRVLAAAKNLLPGKSHEELADEIFADSKLLKKLKHEIEFGLKSKAYSGEASDFVDENHKKASIVISSLVFRSRLKVADIKFQLNNLQLGLDNKFDGTTAWVQNFFIGSYLKLVRSYKSDSTFYAGFDVYVLLSSGNMRHFLELCRTAFSNFLVQDVGELRIDGRAQHISAMQTSEILFREISSFMPHGKRLKLFCGRIGDLFGLFQERNSQSEPEITHFNIRGGFSALDVDSQEFLMEAEKWGILSRAPSTKGKSLDKKDDYDWVLNPIYAPYFFISYRKIRKTYFEPVEVAALISDSSSGFEELRRNRRRKLELGDEGEVPEEFVQRGLF
ncbi:MULTISPECIES: ORC-CDC6 family AAA ATPase [Pseudomonas]|uniref:Uncharacterized protein n=1 Tax=Pseudomonas mosselii TaxID=78327 RepID=A0A5R8Z6E4_9PSED|nr:hypothetical protein [Pseudomonas mosselii]TLP61323.1 hypothetical protein FEM01_12110 [Pseudomonas mosselii]